VLAGEVRRIQPGCHREGLLDRIATTFDLDEVVTNLAGLSSADSALDVALMQSEGMS